jgi:hypothetical protein
MYIRSSKRSTSTCPVQTCCFLSVLLACQRCWSRAAYLIYVGRSLHC